MLRDVAPAAGSDGRGQPPAGLVVARVLTDTPKMDFHRMTFRPLVCCLLLLPLSACQDGGWNFGRDELPPEPPPAQAQTSTSPLIAGTIGEQTLLTGATPEVLRGFGVVVGLEGRGSSDCPSVIREYLIEYLAKQVAPQGTPTAQPNVAPGQLLDSEDTAVVEVTGLVPPGANPGTPFDVRIEAIAGTSTQSLIGGLLLPTQLRYFDPAASGRGIVVGAPLAMAEGPIFVNPFVGEGDSAGTGDPRRGNVLGGGRSLEPRYGRLTLVQPSYAMARAIERRINERFGQKRGVATAMSKGYVQLDMPEEYIGRAVHFRRLIAHMYIDTRPGARERALRALEQLVETPDAPLEEIAIAWEGMGRSVLDRIRPYYGIPIRRRASTRRARACDWTTTPRSRSWPRRPGRGTHSLRLLAVRALEACDSPQAVLHVTPLLSDENEELRIAAYEAVLAHGHPIIRSTRFPHVLDRTAVNLFLRRDRMQRAADGLRPPDALAADRGLWCPGKPAPAGLLHPIARFADGPYGGDGADDVRVFLKRNGRLSDEVTVPPRVSDLIRALADLPLHDKLGRLRGMGLSYSRVLQVLLDLRESETLAVPIVIEQTSMTELFGPDGRPERPEAEPSPDFDRPLERDDVDRDVDARPARSEGGD
jgi:flagellar basal body P-ring protein FlgI